MHRNASTGGIDKVTMYFDPTVQRQIAHNNFIGLGVAWYMVPQDEALARELYLAAVTQAGWRDRTGPAVGSVAMFSILGLLLAQEFGDTAVAEYLRKGIEEVAEPRHFGDSEFGYFFHLGEQFPRGQLSALLMCAEVLTKGQWRSVFSSDVRRRQRSQEPTVEGVEFPALGICRAENVPGGDGESMVLAVDTYAGLRARAGSTTSFRVTNLPLLSHHGTEDGAAGTSSAGGDKSRPGVEVECDGRPFMAWQVTGESSIEITTTIAPHRFKVTYRVPRLLHKARL